MNDRELLELAAKAYGVILNQYETEDFLRADHSMQGRFWNPRWNPLTDDGDALRLAVKLRMIIDPYAGLVGVPPDAVVPTINEGDIYAATRRAIVRAAAEIGKEMP